MHIVAYLDGKEVGRVDKQLTIEAPVQVATNTSARSQTKISKKQWTQDKVVEKLPTAISDVCVGGGRFLILHMPSLRKLAVYDVNQSKIVH